MNELSAISNVLMSVAIILVWLFVIVMIIAGFILAKIYERKFFMVVKENLAAQNFNLRKCTESIRNAYEVYRRHRFGFNNKKIVFICQECSSDIRIGKKLDPADLLCKDEWADRLDEIIKQLQYEEQFDDEKANEIVSILLKGKRGNEVIEQVKQKLIFLEAYHKGVISVKNAEIQDLKEKMQKKQWITLLSGAIGIIGSLASILSFVI